MEKSTNIKSFVGGHDIVVYKNCVYNPGNRKYSGGSPVLVIPYSGKMLNANKKYKNEEIKVNGVRIPIKTNVVYTDVDPIPDLDECQFCIVSNLYKSACAALGIDTSRLLTIGDTVTDSNGRIIGCINFEIN